MDFLIVVAVVVVMLVVAFKLRSIKQQQTAKEDLAKKCWQLAEDVQSARDAALRHPAGSDARKGKVEEARDNLKRLELIASQHPEVKLKGLGELRDQLQQIDAAPAYKTPVKTKAVPETGRVMVCVLDTETTGLSHGDEPISLAMLLLEVELPKGHLVQEVENLYEMREPSVPIHPRAAAVHGLTVDSLRGKRFDTARISSILERADVLIAHNANFDRRMLGRIVPEAERLPWLCSVRHIAWPTNNKKLDTICQHFAIERPEPHNSMSDVRALAECLLRPTGKTARSRSYLAVCLGR